MEQKPQLESVELQDQVAGPSNSWSADSGQGSNGPRDQSDHDSDDLGEGSDPETSPDDEVSATKWLPTYHNSYWSELQRLYQVREELGDIMDDICEKATQKDKRFIEIETLAIERGFKVDELESEGTALRNTLRALNQEREEQRRTILQQAKEIAAWSRMVNQLRQEKEQAAQREQVLQEKVIELEAKLEEMENFLDEEVGKFRAKKARIQESPESP